MRKAILRAFALVLVLSIWTASFALADAVPSAMPLNDLTAWEGTSGFTLDRTSGEWSLVSHEADALLRAVNNGDLRALGASAAVFYLCIEGNAYTGAMTPVLTVLTTGKAKNATAFSLRAGDTRYDIAVARDVVSMGGGDLQRLRAPLNADGLSMLADIRAAEEVTLRVHGDESYTAKLRVKKTYASGKERMEAHSLDCVDLDSALQSLRFADYHMQDSDALNWKKLTGVLPQLSKTDVALEVVPVNAKTPVLDKDMRMLSAGTSGTSAKLLRDKLIELGHFVGASGSNYNVPLKRAVEDVQRIHSLIPSGSLDGQLLNILFGEAAPTTAPAAAENAAPVALPAQGEAAQPSTVYAVADIANLSIDRYWFACTVNSSRSTGAMSEYSASNRDNVLIIADGMVKNLSSEELSFSRSVTATFTLNGKYAYDAVVKCETDGGERLDAYLLPLGESRTIFAAEIPAAAAREPGQWTLTIMIGDQALSYDLGQS